MISHIVPSRFIPTNKNVLKVQNICGFMICMYSLFIYVNTFYKKISINVIDNLLRIILTYTSIDFFVHKSYDVLFHHMTIFGFTIYYNYYTGEPDDIIIFLHVLINTELSSIFYIFKYWLPEDTIISYINLILFFGTFFKFRIYDYYKILHNHSEFTNLFEKNSYNLSKIMVTSIYSLFILNLYWFTIIIKISYKMISTLININREEINKKLLSYLRILKTMMYVHLYFIKPKVIYIVDVITLSFTNNLSVLVKDTIYLHTRSFISILIRIHNLSIIYILLSGILHLYSIITGFLIMIPLHLEYNKDMLKTHDFILLLPIFFDNFLIFMNSPNEIAIPFLIFNIMDILFRIVEPFYNLNKSAIQTILLFKTYYLYSNVNSICH